MNTNQSKPMSPSNLSHFIPSVLRKAKKLRLVVTGIVSGASLFAVLSARAGSGLTVEFDTFLNTGGSDTAPSIDVKVAGGEVNTVSFPGLRTGVLLAVVIQLNPNGPLEVYYDGVPAYTNQDVSAIGQISGG